MADNDKIPVIYCDSGEERELPWKYEICPTCNGKGSHSLRFGAITAADREDWDDESFQDYVDGLYDEVCGCEAGKVRVPDRSKMSTEDCKLWDEQEADRITDESTYRAEMGLSRGY